MAFSEYMNFKKIFITLKYRNSRIDSVDDTDSRQHNCFVHPKFGFWFLVTFVDKVTKILHNLCLHFARQDRQDGNKRKEQLKSDQNTKNQKTKIWDERNISHKSSLEHILLIPNTLYYYSTMIFLNMTMKIVCDD